MEQDLNALTQHWYDRTRMVEKAHFTRCALFRQRHVKLGCITIICTTLLGVLSNLAPDHGTISLDFVGRNMSFDGASDLKMVLTILAPVLTALVSFLRFDEKASMHHNAAAEIRIDEAQATYYDIGMQYRM